MIQHTKHSMSYCTYIFKRGKNIGEPCNKKCCKLHALTTPSNIQKNGCIAVFDSLPIDVLNIIVDKYILTKPTIKTYLALACTNKTLYKLMNDEEKYKELSFQQNLDQVSNMTYKKKLRLYGCIGCELCKKPRVRKVYLDYGVRCCKDCLYANTINDYRLDDYLIQKHVVQRCRYRIATIYNPYSYIHEYTTKFYWKPDVVKAIKSKYNVASLEEYKNSKTRVILQEKRVEMIEYLNSKRTKIPLGDVEKLSSFICDCNSGHVKALVHYYTETRKALVEEKKKTFVESQPDYDMFPYKDAIRTSTHYKKIGRRTNWTIEDWEQIKSEIETEIQRKIQRDKFRAFFFSFFLFLFFSRALTACSNTIRVVNFENLTVEQLENIQITNCSRKGTLCTFCNKQRPFGWPGIADHHRSAHKDTPMKFIVR